MSDITTVQVPKSLKKRLSKLAEQHSKQLGLSRTLGVSKYLEILAGQEELRQKEQS